jgi:hypothetical protein
MPLKFINPFGGKPSKIQLTGLFLFHPQTYFDIGGQSISATFKLLGKESLLKKLESIRPGDKVPRERMHRLIAELLDAVDAPEGLRKRFHDEVEIAMGEDETGEFNPAQMGQYEAAVMAVNSDGKKLEPAQGFFLEMERKSRPAMELAYKQRYSDAVEVVLEDDFFVPFLWDGVRDALSRVRTDEALLLLRISIAMEVFFAGMVIYESSYEYAREKDDPSCLLDVWPVGGGTSKNPFGMLFEWTRRTSGARTQREFFDHRECQNFRVQGGLIIKEPFARIDQRRG